MDSVVILQQMFVLISLMAVGFALRRLNILDQKGNALLTSLTLNVALPAAMLTGVTGSPETVENLYLVYVLGVSILAFLVMWPLSELSARLTVPKTREDRGALTSIGLWSNVAFLGFPLTLSLWGPDYMFYAVLFNLVYNSLALSLGIKILAGSGAKVSLKLIFNLSLVASLLAIALFMLNIQIPTLIHAPLTQLGNMLTPLGVIVLGSILGGMELREAFSDWRVYAATAVKLLVAPVAVYLVLSQFALSPGMLGIFVLLAALPTAPRTAWVASHYGGNLKMVSQGILIATILSVVTIPLLAFLLGL